MIDQFDQDVSGNAETVAAWDSAVLDLLSMKADPMAPLDEVSASDEGFVMGPVFTGSFRLIGAGVPTGPEVTQDLARARARRQSATEQERAHIAAFESLAEGEFFHAAAKWDEILCDHPRDVVAARLAHDVYLHVGNITNRLTSAEKALAAWSEGEAGYGWIMGSYSFALEEAGRFSEAEKAGRLALAENEDDCWALHSLAHTYEHLDAQKEALELLLSNQHWWIDCDLLGGHVWWHLALRLIESGDYDHALAIADDLAEGNTAFRLADITSLLWRLELEGQEVGSSWEPLIERWSESMNLHTSAFIDMHAAMAFASAGDSDAASRFWAEAESPHYGNSENGQFLRGPVLDLMSTIRAYRSGDQVKCEDGFRTLEGKLQQIGGSHAQREILTRTRVKNMLDSDQSAASRYLDDLAASDPTRAWIQRAKRTISDRNGLSSGSGASDSISS